MPRGRGAAAQLDAESREVFKPDVLLLDEPLAGMGAEESARVVKLLRELAADHAIMLVEHHMHAVFPAVDLNRRG